MRKHTLLVLALALWLGITARPSLCAPTPVPAPFALHNGDTVLFYGDSITDQLMYGRDIETFVQTRLPRLHVKFINSGWGGDTVQGGEGGPIDLRLKRDVINYKPTVVTVFLGMNDPAYKPYDEARFQTYAAGLTHIVDTLTRALPGVRITLLAPSMFDYNAQARPPLPADLSGYNYGNPPPNYNQILLRYGAFVKELGAKRHLTVVDTNAPMVAAITAGRKTNPHFALSGDGVHPNEQGHLIIAAAVLTAWHAPLMPPVVLAPGKAVSKTFPLPWPLPAGADAVLPLAPQVAALCAWPVQLRAVNANSSAQYALAIDGGQVCMAQASLLARGVDVTQYALPQSAQAQTVLALVKQRTDAWRAFWKGGGSNGLVHASDLPSDTETAALRAEDAKLDDLRAQARAAAQPRPHTFALTSMP